MISSVATTSLRLATSSPSVALIGKRQLSMAASQSASKLSNILEEYRAQNYTQELPRRFRQDIIKAATSSRQYNAHATISADGIENILQNIGAGNKMSRSEIDDILGEIGECPLHSKTTVISANQLLQLISRN